MRRPTTAILMAALLAGGPALADAPRPSPGRGREAREGPEAARRPRPADLPDYECPRPRGEIPEGAAAAVSSLLGPGAIVVCEGDLNGNGRPEVLAVASERSMGRRIGFYWVARAAGIFEGGPKQKDPWVPALLITDRIENAAGPIGWREPAGPDGIGIRVTMSDGGRICLQARRLEPAGRLLEEPLLLVRWDPSTARYDTGSCRDGTAGSPAASSE